MRTVFTLLFAVLFIACGTERVQPTEVLVRVSSDFGSELQTISVRLFDRTESRRSQARDYSLSAVRPLPLLVPIVPAEIDPETQVLVVISGKNASGHELVVSKVVVEFAKDQLRLVDIFLSQACREVACGAAQTCSPEASGGQCMQVPTEVGTPIEPGGEDKLMPAQPVVRGQRGDGGEPDASLLLPESDGGVPAEGGASDSGLIGNPQDGPSSDASTTTPVLTDATVPPVAPPDSGVMMLDGGRDSGVVTLDGGRDSGVMTLDSGVRDAGVARTIPLGPCRKDSITGCNSYVTEWERTLQLGEMGAVMQPNKGQTFGNQVATSDTTTNCASILVNSYGYTAADAADAADPKNTDLHFYTLYRPANWGLTTRYPVVLWSNQTCLLPEFSGGLLRYIASQGFVVVAPNVRFPTPADLLQALSMATSAMNQIPYGEYLQRLDLNKVAVVGFGDAAAVVANDPRVSTAVLIGTGAVAKPYLMIGAGRTLQEAALFTAAITQSPAAAYLFFVADFTSQLLPVREPERMAEAVAAWLKYRLNGDVTSRAMFVSTSCGLCTPSAVRQYGQRGLD